MSDKLARAQHMRAPKPADGVSPARNRQRYAPGETAAIPVVGSHVGIDRTRLAQAAAQEAAAKRDETRNQPTFGSEEHAGDPSPQRIGKATKGRHAGCDRTASRRLARASAPAPSAHAEPRARGIGGAPGLANAPAEKDDARTEAGATSAPLTRTERAAFPGSTSELPIIGKHAGKDRTLARADTARAAATAADRPDADAGKRARADVGSSTALMSICVMLSRITGFARTWIMAFALGSTLLSSSYQVANNLPNQLYELVVGGMLVTAFLPVYLSVKKRLGERAGNEYASNLLTIVVLFLGIVSLLCIAFPQAAIYTQSFYSDQAKMAQSVFFFQFFAIQIVLYGATAIVSGLLNANRDYLWASIAPVANNVIVIAAFSLYAAIAPHDPQLALYVIALGNPLGVFVQLAIQLPALKKNGIRIRPRIDFRDPALRETVGIGVPAMFVMLCSLIIVSVQNAASYGFADNGPSILLYARQWFTLPYAFLAVPITTAMFTELAAMQAEGDADGVKRGIVRGTNQILFFMIPFALYLMVFSLPLVTLYHAGAFTMDDVADIASYMSILAFALPVYGVNTYLQKVFSSIRKMGVFAAFNFVAGAVQIALTLFAASNAGDMPLEAIAAAEVAFYVVADVCLFAYLRHRMGSFGLVGAVRAFATGLALGLLGAAAGAGVLIALQNGVAPLDGSILQALAYVVAGGLASLFVTFGLALKLKVPEADFLGNLFTKAKGKLGR